MEAAKLRLRPILMTAFAFILGVLPLVRAAGAGAEGRKVMGMAVFAGMLVATILGVILVPVLFVVVETALGRSKKQEATRPAGGARAAQGGVWRPPVNRALLAAAALSAGLLVRARLPASGRRRPQGVPPRDARRGRLDRRSPLVGDVQGPHAPEAHPRGAHRQPGSRARRRTRRRGAGHRRRRQGRLLPAGRPGPRAAATARPSRTSSSPAARSGRSTRWRRAPPGSSTSGAASATRATPHSPTSSPPRTSGARWSSRWCRAWPRRTSSCGRSTSSWRSRSRNTETRRGTLDLFEARALGRHRVGPGGEPGPRRPGGHDGGHPGDREVHLR